MISRERSDATARFAHARACASFIRQTSRKSLFLVLSLALCLGASCFLPGCGNTSSSASSNASEQEKYQGTLFTLGNLSIIMYDEELVHNTAGKECLCIYLHVTNNSSSAESVMGSYNVSRSQGASEHLKVAVAYDTNGNALHTGSERIEPGETADVALCFVLENDDPVTITFGNAERGIKETTLTIPLPSSDE